VPVLILTARDATSDRIAGREPPENWNFGHLEEIWNPNARR
jgi:hypothetical protein